MTKSWHIVSFTIYLISISYHPDCFRGWPKIGKAFSTSSELEACDSAIAQVSAEPRDVTGKDSEEFKVREIIGAPKKIVR